MGDSTRILDEKWAREIALVSSWIWKKYFLEKKVGFFFKIIHNSLNFQVLVSVVFFRILHIVIYRFLFGEWRLDCHNFCKQTHVDNEETVPVAESEPGNAVRMGLALRLRA